MRGEQDKLSETLGIGHLEYHVHRDPPVNHVHVDIELVQASERRLGNGPEGENEAHGGEGALASR